MHNWFCINMIISKSLIRQVVLDRFFTGVLVIALILYVVAEITANRTSDVVFSIVMLGSVIVIKILFGQLNTKNKRRIGVVLALVWLFMLFVTIYNYKTSISLNIFGMEVFVLILVLATTIEHFI